MNSSRKARAFSRFTAWTLMLVLVLPLSAIPALAQATTGTLRGTVTDANGGAVAGANVTVKSEATGTVSPIKTTGEGTFDVPALQPGTYTVTVEAPGFKRSVSTGVAVKIGIVNPVAVVLEAGNVSETVTVTSNTEEIVQRDQAQISTTIDTRRVQDLPSNGAAGGIDTLALLAPGVVANRSGGTNTNGAGLSVNGNRGRSNNFQIDGADNNDLSVAGPALFVDFQDSVQEYQVITNNFSAQYGRNQGAIVNIVSKGGTNQFHGSAFDLHQDAAFFNSLNNLEKRSGQAAPNRNLLNVFGGTIGGPVWLPRFGEGGKSWLDGKDRFFFFFGLQDVRNPANATGSNTNLAIVASEFPRLLSTFPGSPVIQAITKYSPFAINLRAGAVPNIFVPGTGVSSLVNPAAPSGCPKSIPTGTSPAAGCGTYVGTPSGGSWLIGGPFDVINLGSATAPQLFQAAQYQRTVADPYRENYYTTRFDFKVSNKDNITFRFLKQTQDSVAGVGCCSGGFIGDLPATSKHMGADWTHTFGSSMVLTFRPNYQRIGVEFGGGCNTGDAGCLPGPADIGQAVANITFPVALGLTKTSSALATIGPATNLPQGRIGKVYQYPVDISYTRGRHSWIFGAEYKHYNEISPFLPNFNGAYQFNSATRIVNDAPSSIAVTLGDPTLAFTENDQYYYAQDDFKIRPNLTLNLGVRYEYTGQPINILHDETVARESNPATAFFNPALPLSIRTVPAIPADKNNFAPRLGFAYSPHFWKSILGEDATVIRGGFSIAYDATFYNILLNVQNGAPFSAAISFPSNLLTSTTSSPAPLPGDPVGTTVRNLFNGAKGQQNPLFQAQTQVAPDFRSPYSEQWSLGVQHQFGRHHVAEVRYVGTHGVGLFQNVNGNFFIGPLLNGFTITRNGVTRTFPGFPSLLPAGIHEQACSDVSSTPFDNEGACNRRLLPQAGITIRQNSSQSIYHAMQSRYNGRFFNDSLSLGLAYTWSKTIDDSSEIFAETDIGSPNAQNPFCINRCERGPSALDRPHAFAANFIYDFPLFKEQKGFVGHMVGGWQLNGTYILTSGATFTPSQTGNGTTLGLGNTYLTAGDRPFLTNPNADRRQVGITAIDARLLFGAGVVPNSALGGASDLTLYSLTNINATGTLGSPITANAVKYVFNGPGAAQLFGTPFGSAGRNIERGPIFNQMNASLFKNIKVRENLTLQLRGEAFNVLNHPNPGIGSAVASVANNNYIPIINVNSAGTPGAAFGNNDDISYARRVIQVGIRIIF